MTWQPTLGLPEPPAPEPEPAGPLPGEIRGIPEGIGAGIEVWCGPKLGWREFGPMLTGRTVIVQYQGRLLAGLTFDLGEP